MFLIVRFVYLRHIVIDWRDAGFRDKKKKRKKKKKMEFGPWPDTREFLGKSDIETIFDYNQILLWDSC